MFTASTNLAETTELREGPNVLTASVARAADTLVLLHAVADSISPKSIMNSLRQRQSADLEAALESESSAFKSSVIREFIVGETLGPTARLLILAMAGEVTSNVLVPGAMNLPPVEVKAGITSRFGIYAVFVDFLLLFVNISGAWADGFASVVEKRGVPIVSTKAVRFRRGFLSAYTSFVGVAVHAGELATDVSFLLGLLYIIASFSLGAIAFIVGRKIAWRFPWHAGLGVRFADALAIPLVFLVLGHAACHSEDRTTAEDDPIDSVVGSDVPRFHFVNALGPLTGIMMACGGVLLGGALGSTSRANASACGLAVLAHYIMFARESPLAPGDKAERFKRVTVFMSPLIITKFIGSFCGSVSMFCGTVVKVYDTVRLGRSASAARGLAFDFSCAFVCMLFVASLRRMDQELGTTYQP